MEYWHLRRKALRVEHPVQKVVREAESVILARNGHVVEDARLVADVRDPQAAVVNLDLVREAIVVGGNVRQAAEEDRVAAARIGVDDEKRDHAIDPDRVIKDPAEIDQEVVNENVDRVLDLAIVVIERNARTVKKGMNVNTQFHVLDQKVLLDSHLFVKNCHQKYLNVM